MAPVSLFIADFIFLFALVESCPWPTFRSSERRHVSAGCAHVSECVLSVSMGAWVRLDVGEERAVRTCTQSHSVKPHGDTRHWRMAICISLTDVSAWARRALYGNRMDAACGRRYLWGDVVGGFILCSSAGSRGRSLIYSMLCRWPAWVGERGHVVSAGDRLHKEGNDFMCTCMEISGDNLKTQKRKMLHYLSIIKSVFLCYKWIVQLFAFVLQPSSCSSAWDAGKMLSVKKLWWNRWTHKKNYIHLCQL